MGPVRRPRPQTHAARRHAPARWSPAARAARAARRPPLRAAGRRCARPQPPRRQQARRRRTAGAASACACPSKAECVRQRGAAALPPKAHVMTGLTFVANCASSGGSPPTAPAAPPTQDGVAPPALRGCSACGQLASGRERQRGSSAVMPERGCRRRHAPTHTAAARSGTHLHRASRRRGRLRRQAGAGALRQAGSRRRGLGAARLAHGRGREAPPAAAGLEQRGAESPPRGRRERQASPACAGRDGRVRGGRPCSAGQQRASPPR